MARKYKVPKLESPELLPAVELSVIDMLEGIIHIAKQYPFATFAAGMVFGTAVFGKQGDTVKALELVNEAIKIRNCFVVTLEEAQQRWAARI